jgi:alpha-L-fucosidase 2
MGCACDQEAIWNAFSNLIEAAEVLAVDEPLVGQVRDARARLALPAVGPDGRLKEWRHDLEEAEPGHRHVSHLFGLMPGNRLSVRKTPDLARAARASLDGRLSHNYHAQGWSLGWVASLLVRLGEGDRALELIGASYSRKLYPNLFVDAHDQVQVGDMMGVPAAMAEMFVQSQDGEIHLLPALPAEWRSGSLRGFCARGGFTVDLDWADGRPTAATIVSTRGGPCTVRCDEQVATIDTQPNARQSVSLVTD